MDENKQGSADVALEDQWATCAELRESLYAALERETAWRKNYEQRQREWKELLDIRERELREARQYAEGLRAQFEKWQDRFSEAMQNDLEHGVKWLNTEASRKFREAYPSLCSALTDFQQALGDLAAEGEGR